MAPDAQNVLTDENRKMVAEAKRLFSDGRYNEAAVIAAAVIENDEYCVEALAIHGDCHERLGEYALALSCYKTILMIQPDSQLDRIRVARLDKLVMSDEVDLGEPQNRRRTALSAAIAAAILLVSSGSALFLASQPAGESDMNVAALDGTYSEPFMNVAPVPGISNFKPNTQAGPVNDELEGVRDKSVQQTEVSPLVRDAANNVVREMLTNPSGTLADISGTRPVDPGVVPGQGIGLEPSNITGTRPGIGDPDPATLEDGGTEDPNEAMIVEVKPSQNQDPTLGSQEVTNGTEAETLIRVAREHFIVHDYAKAAGAYEKAIEAGASPASANQRLAQCYEKLNRRANAITAYERSIAAFEKLDQTDNRVRLALDSCRQALKLLRGQ